MVWTHQNVVTSAHIPASASEGGIFIAVTFRASLGVKSVLKIKIRIHALDKVIEKGLQPVNASEVRICISTLEA